MLDIALISAGVLFAVLVLIFSLGLIISRFQLKRMMTADEVAKHRVRSGRERMVDSIQSGIQWIAVIAFYLGFPFMLALAVIVTIEVINLATEGLHFLVSHAGVVSLRVLIPFGIVIILAVLSLVVLIAGFFVDKDRDRTGKTLTPEAAPKLFQLVEEVARTVQSKMVDRVEVHLDPNFAVGETGSTLGVLFGRGRRVLHLGLAGLRGYSESHLKSILAHEFGHFAHGETRVLAILAGVIVRLEYICSHYRSLGAVGVFHPVHWYSAIYLWIFKRLVASVSRRREFLADRMAAVSYGGKVYADSLQAVGRNIVVFHAYFLPVAQEMRLHGFSVTNTLSIMDAIDDALATIGWDPSSDDRQPEEPDPTGTHPSDEERIAAVAHLEGREKIEDKQWIDLLENVDQLALEFTESLVNGIDAMLFENNIHPGEHHRPEPDVEAKLTSALAIFREASNRFEKDSTEENLVRMQSATQALQKVPHHQTFLIDQLHLLSKAQSRCGQFKEAEVSLDRAIALIEEYPEAKIAKLELESVKRSVSENIERIEREKMLHEAKEQPPQQNRTRDNASPPSSGKIKVCASCGSAVTEEEIERFGSCPWCGSVNPGLQ